VIQGSKTQIKGVGATGKVAIDPANNEIYLATPDQTILVFDRMANGNVAPKRVLGGPLTQLSLGKQNTNPEISNGGSVYGGGNVPAIRIDPIHNLLLVPTQGGDEANGGGGRVLVFDRTASGNTPPKAVIKGPVRMGNQFAVYSPKSRLVSYTGTNIEIWKVPDSGESTEPPVKISAPLGRMSGDIGIVLDPLHKTVIVASSAGNAILTFFVPEVYDDQPAREISSASAAATQ
jgi:hypothetical protein